MDSSGVLGSGYRGSLHEYMHPIIKRRVAVFRKFFIENKFD